MIFFDVKRFNRKVRKELRKGRKVFLYLSFFKRPSSQSFANLDCAGTT